jgi:hypothetical protein
MRSFMIVETTAFSSAPVHHDAIQDGLVGDVFLVRAFEGERNPGQPVGLRKAIP